LPCPPMPPSSLRCVVIPINYDQAHWCIVIIVLKAGCVVEVAKYDPVQGAYDERINATWTKSCLPMLQKWYGAYGLDLPLQFPCHFVTVEEQHDGSSCGVYCTAIAYDYISETSYFQRKTAVGKSASCQFRVRLMWRIFL
jgi:Ulp1 family protease